VRFLAVLPGENDPVQDATRMIAETLCAGITFLPGKIIALHVSALEANTDEPIQSGNPLAETAREGC
jgi:hypothetical protein